MAQDELQKRMQLMQMEINALQERIQLMQMGINDLQEVVEEIVKKAKNYVGNSKFADKQIEKYHLYAKWLKLGIAFLEFCGTMG